MSNSIHVDFCERIPAAPWSEKVVTFIGKILDRLDIDNWELSVMFCDDPFIAELNKKYRDIDEPTDVLSFEQGDEYIDHEDVTWFNAGDIVISLETLAANAARFSISANEEMKRLLIHGILHLDGMDHSDNSSEQEMLQFQEHLLSGFPADVVFEE